MKKVKKVRTMYFIVLLCSILFINVFGQEKDNKNQSSTAAPQKQQEKVVAANDSGKEADTQTSYQDRINERYRIGFQDTLEIQVNRHPDLSQTVSIGPDGTILMPRVDHPIVAVCKTERELGETITALYKSFLRNPFVTVRAVDQRSQSFAVIGAVNKPGNFFLNRKIRLLELISFAGGQDVEKAGYRVQVTRAGNQSSCRENTIAQDDDSDIQFFSYNLKDVLDGKQNPWLEPGDIVSVLEAEEAYVVGNVNKPVTISLKEPRTLTQALAIAEGTDATANTDKVIIQRQEPGGTKKTELVFDLNEIRDKKIPDPLLQANDIVEVSNDKIKSVKKGILKIFTSVLPSAAYRIP